MNSDSNCIKKHLQTQRSRVFSSLSLFRCGSSDLPTMVSHSHTTVFPPVQGDNLFKIFLYTSFISEDLAQYEIFHAKVCDFW